MLGPLAATHLDLANGAPKGAPFASACVASRKESAVSDWAFEGCYAVLGYSFRVRTAEREHGLFVDRVLEPFRMVRANGVPCYEMSKGPEGDRFVLRLDGRLVQQAELPAPVLDYLIWDVNVVGVDETTGFLALHASAASLDGVGVVMSAPMDSGKTTLVAGLTRAGFSYLTDEAALIDLGTGMLHPFPKALWMDRRSVDVVGLGTDLPLDQRGLMENHIHVRAEDIRSASVGDPCPVGVVLAPRYTEGAESRIEPMKRADMLMMLAGNSFNFRKLAPPALDLLAKLLRDTRCYRLQVGDLDSAIELVTKVVKER